jgi:putative endonuclease
VSKDNFSSGRIAEDLAGSFLESRGFRILFRNYKAACAEIDIIARENNVICFVEVKSRASEKFGSPQEAVTPAKQRKIGQAALIFLKENNLLEARCRFDVVAISQQSGKPVFELFRDAFILND